MLWCDKCLASRSPNHLSTSANLRCPLCTNILSSNPNPNPSPPPRLRSHPQSHSILNRQDFVHRSHQQSLNFIDSFALKLSIFDAFAVQQARKFYQTAGEHDREREGEGDSGNGKVGACCLYIACLLNRVPVLLFRFSVELGVNVYELGAEYLRLCRVLGFKLSSFVQKAVDPSLFIHRYVGEMFKERNLRVCMVALRIVECAKGELMRDVGGVCGAAVYVAALACGLTCRKSDVERGVRFCDRLFSGRLIEFGKKESGGGGLTVDEFRRIAKEFEDDEDLELREFGGDLEVLCRHKDEMAYRYGLCNSCYKEFVQLCKRPSCKSNTQSFDRAKVEALIWKCNNDKFGFSKKFGSVSSSGSDESEDLSEVEVDEYLGDDKEAEGKKVLWEAVNKEYIREQVLKKSAAAPAIKKPKKKQMQKPGSKVDNATAPTSAETTHQASSKKRLNSLINFDALTEMFEDDVAPDGKKNRTESHHDTNALDEEAAGVEIVGGDSDNEDHQGVEYYDSDCDFF
ncbi:hypothetical protein DCAR_0415095 [Daucus carota subsp. sativus]|uniref:Uncharacterized protein n=1 Tax=Daucus carota subsp. sativus TaxID=79200 RepID=A0A165A6V6_DAUCS|nr:PREDICTED: transcription factor IIIB 90 kDa subunit-like [Daucus carota subsp. sativus]WOG95768.1 hypothetical protein DCAR_0415095 [Daucus carota subsp. sativus]